MAIAERHDDCCLALALKKRQLRERKSEIQGFLCSTACSTHSHVEPREREKEKERKSQRYRKGWRCGWM